MVDKERRKQNNLRRREREWEREKKGEQYQNVSHLNRLRVREINTV